MTDYRGQRLGLPPSGPGSLATLGRRLAAVAVDWFASTFVVALVARDHLRYGTPTFSFAVLLVFGVEVFALTWLTGGSFGQRLLGLRVVALDARRLSPLRVLGRTVLLCLAVPALVWDSDQRGLHERATDTAVLNAR